MTSVDSSTDEYPEHAKMAAVQDQSQAIGEFLENSKYGLVDDDDNPVHESIIVILAEYFDIDLDKIESEKRTMLARTRGTNE